MSEIETMCEGARGRIQSAAIRPLFLLLCLWYAYRSVFVHRVWKIPTKRPVEKRKYFLEGKHFAFPGFADSAHNNYTKF